MRIEAVNISKAFGKHQIFKDYSISFPKGRITAIMSPSGSGKTTLLNILMGIIIPDQGEIRGLEGRKSAVFQEDRLCMNLSVYANIKMVNKKLTSYEIREALEQLELEECLHRPVKELSGGMKRRVAILRALLSDYEVLFLDEPFQGLDQETKETVIKYMKKRIEDKTVIMVTHDILEAKIMGADIVSL